MNLPTIERLAKNGLTYTNFHTAPICSASRVALLTGRNPHSANMGTVSEMATSFPGQTSVLPNSVAPLAKILRFNGYSTAMFGKSHEYVPWESGLTGPFDHWPILEDIAALSAEQQPPARVESARQVRLATSARTAAYLLDVVMFALQLSERIARVLEKLHLRQVGAQRVGGSRHCRNRGVTGLLGGMARFFGGMARFFGGMARFFGGMARFFGGLPKRFPLLSDRLELTPNALTYFPRFLGQHAEVFSRRPGRFRLDAALFDTAARLLDVLSLVLRQFACAFSLDATVFHRSFGHLSLPTALRNRPTTTGFTSLGFSQR
jgi:Sulfatase